MRNIWIVALREYRERVKSPVFIVSALIALIGTLAMPILIFMLSGDVLTKARQIAVYDATGKVAPAILQYMEPSDLNTAAGQVKWDLKVITEQEIDKYEAKAHSGEVFGVLHITGTFPSGLVVTFKSSGASNVDQADAFGKAISRIAHEGMAKAAGVDDQLAKQLVEPIEVKKLDLSSGGQQDSRAAMSKFGLSFIVMMLVYTTVLSSGSMLFQGVMEEKTSRVVELIAASVKPVHMMLGKIIGLGMLSLTQFGLAIVGLGAVTGIMSAMAIDMGIISLGTLGLVALLSIMGYVMFAALFAAAGATVSRIEDSGMAMMPVLLPVMVPLFLSTFILAQPDSPMAVAFSLIPLFSPTIMAQRLVLSHPPGWQIVTCLLSLVGTIALFVWLAGRIYKVSIMSYGNRPTLKQLWGYITAD